MVERRKTISDRFYLLLETLFKELDQEAIVAEVNALKADEPKASREELAKILTKRAAIRTASIGAAAGAPGGPLGLLAMAPDIFNLVRQQSRLVLAIAFLYDRRPGLQERFREVLATLAASTGTSAARRGARYFLAKGLEGSAARKIVRRIVGRFAARKLPSIAPIVGSVLGGTLNWLSVQAVGKAALEYYSHGFEEKTKEKKNLQARTERKTTVTKSSSAKKASPRKTAAKKSNPR